MIFYAWCVFLSAFLLFQVQPMISRYILPFFGGTTAVWSTVQLFFEVFLTAGYAYAAWLVRKVPVKMQAWVHAAVLTASLILLMAPGKFWPSPVMPDASWKPVSVDSPILDIFKVLILAVGLPYFLLSTNSPLMQAWFNRKEPGRSPYWLYALSNTGSLLGLLAYPFVIESNLTLKVQGWAWSGGYALFVVLAGYAAIQSRLPQGSAPEKEKVLDSRLPSTRPGFHHQALWILLSAIASTMLLATTSQITQEVATTPFLWVLPLSIYLLSFILCFSSERWYNRRIFGGLLILASAGYGWALVDTHPHLIPLIAVYCFLLFVSVMICNGETYRLRPDPAHLTRFYLMTSIGGALGGLFVNLLAPVVFKGYWELPISFALTWTLLMVLFVTRRKKGLALKIQFILNVMVSAAILLVGGLSVYSLAGGTTSGDIFVQRNFYGVVHVRAVNPTDSEWQGYEVVHGITIHGMQFSAPDKHNLPTVYYTEQSGIGLALLNHPKYGKRMRVGLLGLGIGTLAAYGQPGDTFRAYEINPIMIDLANGMGGYFSYLRNSQAEITIVPGDARISLERELVKSGSDNFDVLALDVFSSDSVPVHLVTKEAFEIYLHHLAPDGIIAANISNRHLDLVPVLCQQAEYFHLEMAVIPTEASGPREFASSWVLLARDPALLQIPEISTRAVSMEGYETSIPLWTDDFSNLFQILK